MKLSIGIVGLPNVGKSTLFNALLKKQVADVANYPFCTIEPNIGIVEVPDSRLPILAKIVKTEKIIPAVVEFYDIAGLVKGASTGEGLGNKFLANIREVATIAHVVRLFEDSAVSHVTNQVNPSNDIQIIESELILADLETLKKAQSLKLKTQNQNLKPKSDELFKITVDKLYQQLNNGIPGRSVSLSDKEKGAVKHLNLLTMKPQIFVFNVSEQQLVNKQKTEVLICQSLSEVSQELVNTNSTNLTNFNYLFLNAKLENDVLSLPENEQKEYLRQYHLEETGLNRLIKKAYETLGLISFLTAPASAEAPARQGPNYEVRAWTITKGTLAPQAAGVIHTDFEKHFIKADVIPYPEFVAYGGWLKAREMGKVATVGKDYEMKDGDVVEFKVGI